MTGLALLNRTIRRIAEWKLAVAGMLKEEGVDKIAALVPC